MAQRQRWLHPVDEQLVAALEKEGIGYVPVLAESIGVRPAFAQQRVERLVAQGLIERVTPEPVYRVTRAGATRLEGRAALPTPSVGDG